MKMVCFVMCGIGNVWEQKRVGTHLQLITFHATSFPIGSLDQPMKGN